MGDPKCIIWDINGMLAIFDRIRGNKMVNSEIKEFVDCLANCNLQEMRSFSSYFSWTNKTVWSRIDRAFTNNAWHDDFDFIHVEYLYSGLLDHTPCASLFQIVLD